MKSLTNLVESGLNTLKYVSLGAGAVGILFFAGCKMGPITNLEVTTAPLQVNPGAAATLGGTGENYGKMDHQDGNGNHIGENGELFYPGIGINHLELVAENFSGISTLPYIVTGKFRDGTLEELDSLSHFANPPTLLIDNNEWSFWVSQLGAQAKSELTAIQNLINPNNEDLIAWGVNQSGIYAELEVKGGIQGYSDSNNSGNADYAIRFTPASTSTLNQSSIDELSGLLTTPPTAQRSGQLVANYFAHVLGPVTVENDIVARFLPLTGKAIPVDVSVEYTLSGGNVAANFTRDPNPANRTDITTEQSLNGQSAAGTYTRVSADIIEPAASGKGLIDLVQGTINYHAANQ
tara:strand:- start:8354 stop:9403 length:1050 start_codon:yes stop_codon:yes gene_type:complete